MRKPIQVLIVEDKAEPRETLELNLEGFDCEFYYAESAASALELIRERTFDVIFLDLRLPDGNGLDVLREARKLRADLGKIIVTTGYPDEHTEREARRLGVFDYLVKFDYNGFRAAFARATSTSPQPAEPTVAVVAESQTPTDASVAVGIRSVEKRGLPHLLVLDNDKAWLDAIHEALQNDFDLTMTPDPDKACELAENEVFALAIIDMRLGETTGLDVLKRLRESAPRLRAIILTGFPDYAMAFESGKSNALAYVEKSDLATLGEKVKEILSHKTEPTRVFLSYAKRDHDLVLEVFNELTKRGFLPWMADKTLVPGQAWKLEIQRAINEANYFVFCHSRNSARREGSIREEVHQALERLKGMNDDRIFFVTVRLDKSEVAPPLTERQYVDLFESDGLYKLLKALSSDEG